MMMMGPVEAIVFLLGLTTAAGLPLSVPPLPPDPVIERAAPDACLLHVALAGMAKPAAGSANRAEALLAEADVRRFVDQMAAAARKMMDRAAANGDEFPEEARELLYTLLTRPAALTVDSFAIGGQGPDVEASLVVNCGPEVEAVRRALAKLLGPLEAAGGPAQTFEAAGQKWSRLEQLPGGGPEFAWGFKDGYFMAAIGTDALEHLFDRLADKARKTPDWKAALDKRLPLDRRSMLVHADVAAGLEAMRAAGPVPAQVDAGIEASGLGGIAAFQALAGLTKTELASAAIVDFKTDPTGLLVPGRGVVAAADLKRVPADATMAQVVKLDLSATLAAALAWMEAVQPGSSAQATQALEQVRAVAGFDVNDHLLEPLGDTWTVFTLPGAGFAEVPRAAAIVGLDDAKTFAKTHRALLGLVRQALAQPGTPPLQLDERKAGDTTIYTAGLEGAPVRPAWCIHGDRLLVAVSADLLEKVMARTGDGPSLADVAEVQALLDGKTAALGYQEPRAAVAALAAAYEALTPFVGPELAAAGAEMPKLPPTDVVTRHLLPAVSVVRRDATGDILAEGRSTLPLGPLGGPSLGAAPAAMVGLLLPAVQAAREAARRTASMNNARQIALSMMMSEAANGKLPAAAICDKEGKPLLSWRVAMLPYLEENALYREFHLDEPWDSEHNKKLLERMPPVYEVPGDQAAKPGTTRYLVPAGKGTIFAEPGKALQLGEVADGTSKTILLVEAEAAKAVPWTKPEDLPIDPKQPHAGLKDARPTGFLAVFADGGVQLIPGDVTAEALAAMFTAAGNEVVEMP
jgi:hypothetical protein